MMMWMMKTLHHWFGVVFAAFFFVVSITGVWVTLAKYSGETLSDSRMRQPVGHLSPIAAQNKVAIILDKFDRDTVTKIDFPIRGRSAFVVRQNGAPSIFLEQQNLETIRIESKSPLTDFMRRVHVNLLNPFNIGREIVVWTGLVGAFLAMLGVVIFVPQWRAFQASHIAAPHGFSYREMRRSHVSSGIVFAVAVAFFGLSGWAIGDRAAATGILQSFDAPAKRPPSRVTVEYDPEANNADLSALVRIALQKFPEGKITSIDINGRRSKGLIHIRIRHKGELSSFGESSLSFHLNTGELVREENVKTLGGGSRTMNAAYSLHSGRGMGIFYQLIISIVGVITAILCMTGLMSYVMRWRRRLIKRKAR